MRLMPGGRMTAAASLSASHCRQGAKAAGTSEASFSVLVIASLWAMSVIAAYPPMLRAQQGVRKS